MRIRPRDEVYLGRKFCKCLQIYIKKILLPENCKSWANTAGDAEPLVCVVLTLCTRELGFFLTFCACYPAASVSFHQSAAGGPHNITTACLAGAGSSVLVVSSVSPESQAGSRHAHGTDQW